jgi:rhamnosyltransferase
VLISIVIPVFNGAYWLEETLSAIVNQTLFDKSEIIIIDSGSTDNSLEIAARFPVKIIQISTSDFNHGETRNLGVREAQGEYVVLTVQDAKPADDLWLQKLLDGFIHPKVSGVCGHQIVPHDPRMNPVSWFRPQSEPVITEFHFPDPEDFNRLSPLEKRRACGWDDVTAMYRRKDLLERPFRKVFFGEDIQWAKDMLLSGGHIVLNHAARVYHYHFDNPEFSFKRVYSECFFKYRLFQLIPSLNNSLLDYLRDIKIIATEQKLSLGEKYKWILYNIKLRNARNTAVRQFNKDLHKGDDFLEKNFYSRFLSSPAAPVPVDVL